MKARIIAVCVLVLVVVVIAWNAIFYGPAGDAADKAKQREVAAAQARTQLTAQLKALQDVAAKGPEFQAKIDTLSRAVPLTPDLEGFTRSANDLKTKTGIDWVSVQNAVPSSGAGLSEIKMQIIVSGGYYQILDYLTRLQQLRRIVVIDGINITVGSDDSPSSSGASSATPTTKAKTSGGAPNLTVSLSARMFTQAPPADAGTGTKNRIGTTPTPTAAATGGAAPATPTIPGGAN